MDDLDEAAWGLAGRLMLMTHVQDFRDGYISDVSRSSRLWHDHQMLTTQYGYDMTGCECAIQRTVGNSTQLSETAVRRRLRTLRT